MLQNWNTATATYFRRDGSKRSAVVDVEAGEAAVLGSEVLQWNAAANSKMHECDTGHKAQEPYRLPPITPKT